MIPAALETLPAFPHRHARAPRADDRTGMPRNWLRAAPPALQGAVVALIGRDTRGIALDAAQRLSHFPASPLVTISWYRGLEAGLVEDGEHGPAWQPFGAGVVVSGSQCRPVTSWAPTTGCGAMACFTADAAQMLFGIDLLAIQDRFLPAAEAMDPRWHPFLEALHACGDDEVPALLERFLAARWQSLQGRDTARPSLRQLGRHWVERLAIQAQEWRRTQSPRHVERRIKAFSGRSLREWQSLVRTEGLFFAARDLYESGQHVDWAALAADEGFSDQAHMSRLAKRITGFSPGDFAQRFIEDESFWMYRLWV